MEGLMEPEMETDVGAGSLGRQLPASLSAMGMLRVTLGITYYVCLSCHVEIRALTVHRH